MKAQRLYLYLSIFLTIGGLSGCYPIAKDIPYEDLDIALTVYDKDYYSKDSYNYFQDFQTFVIPDTVVHITEDGVPDEISRDYDKYIIGQVRSNMLKLGFTEETNPEISPADIALTISATTSEHIVYDWYPYWAWYWGSEKDGMAAKTSNAGNDYPWNPYYGYGTQYTYTAGSVILEMVDVAKIDETSAEIPVIWAGLINGAVGGPPEGIENRLSTGIDRCFNQSPYLFK